jgi:hypothetical protein
MDWVCLAEEPMKSADDLIQVIAGERIQNILRFATRSHEVGGAKLCQMLGERRLPEARQLLQLGHPPLAPEQLAKDEEAMLVAHRLESSCRRPGRAAGDFYIHSC